MTRRRTSCNRISVVATAIVLLAKSALLAADSAANPSFSTTMGDTIRDHDFGVFKLGATGATFNLDVYNLAALSGTTSNMTMSGVNPFGDSTALSLQGTISGLSPGASTSLQLVLTTSRRGRLAVLYTLDFASDSVPAAPLGHLSLAGHAIVSPPGDYDSDGDVDSTDYGIWRSHFGSNFAAADGNQNGIVDAADFVVWQKNYSGPGGSGSSLKGSDDLASVAVPEPAAAILGLLGTTFVCLRPRNRKCRIGKPWRACN